MYMAKARIPVPSARDPLGVLELAAKLVGNITVKGKDSLIVGELASELQAATADVPAALKAHEDAKALTKQIEKLYEQRDAAVAKLVPLLQRGSKALQGALPAARLREMGDYGYTVNDSPTPAATAARKAKAAKTGQ